VSYTAIGDGVNLASRLEGLNKYFGTRIIVSEAIEQRARHAFAFRRLDKVAVKGKSKAVAVFELLGPLDAPRVERVVCERYEQALAAYAGRDFAKACALLSEQPEDGPSRALHARCTAYVSAPPEEGWDATLHPEK
jgi:adenylate cyclase